MGYNGENEGLAVLEMTEVRQGLVLRLQESPEFMKPVGPIVNSPWSDN
jgi:hypothetical protein